MKQSYKEAKESSNNLIFIRILIDEGFNLINEGKLKLAESKLSYAHKLALTNSQLPLIELSKAYHIICQLYDNFNVELLKELKTLYDHIVKRKELPNLCLINLLLGKFYYEIKEFEKATSHLNNALKIGSKIELKNTIWQIYYLFYKIEQEKEDYISAKIYQVKSREIIDEFKREIKSEKLLEQFTKNPIIKDIYNDSI